MVSCHLQPRVGLLTTTAGRPRFSTFLGQGCSSTSDMQPMNWRCGTMGRHESLFILSYIHPQQGLLRPPRDVLNLCLRALLGNLLDSPLLPLRRTLVSCRQERNAVELTHCSYCLLKTSIRRQKYPEALVIRFSSSCPGFSRLLFHHGVEQSSIAPLGANIGSQLARTCFTKS